MIRGEDGSSDSDNNDQDHNVEPGTGKSETSEGVRDGEHNTRGRWVHEGTPEHVAEEEEQTLLQEKGMVEV